MKVLFIVRSTLFTVKGGDTIQVMETARELIKLGIATDIKKANEKIDYTIYDLLHFFNITRPADMLVHIKRSKKPFVITPILVDYGIYDRYHRKGAAGTLFKLLSRDSIEYVKTLYRAMRRKDSLVSVSYVWKGQHKSIREILQQAKCVLVNADDEYRQLVKWYAVEPPFMTVPNGIDTSLFIPQPGVKKDPELLLCVARIEGIKNQHHLIRAVNNTSFKLLLIGDAAPNQEKYYEQCKRMAAANVSFLAYVPQEELTGYYARAKVHVLPSWFEVCGLSSLEAAAMGCRVVITDNGYARSYFKDDAFYCDPAQPASILAAIQKAAGSDVDSTLQSRIIDQYSWQQTAEKIVAAYKKYML